MSSGKEWEQAVKDGLKDHMTGEEVTKALDDIRASPWRDLLEALVEEVELER